MLAAARSSFGKKGYTQTSVDEIAAEARVTKGAVYHPFADKEALFRAVHAEVEAEAVHLHGSPAPPPSVDVEVSVGANASSIRSSSSHPAN